MDSVSQATYKSYKRSSQKSSRVSSKSKVSVSAAFLQAEAERAALKAKAQALEKKHVLDMEEAQLKVKKEKLALESEMAAADAKVNVFLKSESLLGKMSSRSTKGSAKSDTSSTYPSTEYIAPARTLKVQITQDKQGKKGKSTPTVKTHQSHEKTQKHKRDSSTLDNTALADVLKKQNEITAWLIKQQQTSLLPTREIPVFGGDPLQFRSFIKAFEQGIESKTDSMQDRLYYLEQFTVGQPKNLVRIYLHMDPVIGYKEAKQQLEWNFSNSIKISSAFIEKALNWTALKAEDGPALRSYALFLCSCFNTLQEIKFVEELENSANLRTIVSKLPFKLRDKWRTIACNIQDSHNRKVKLKDLEFIERET
ncbi:uncharacterized protein LOC125244793 [Megalobrama amblycephala]|uniref:uncharacterized protein LOC125244793 n=1 Tax=Megalobrama amblycephala TaxID=75352 RepID=UPI002013DBC6|nr:uncharacterized protein LOC125244793 [Megalobrama amblycephala]